MEAKGNEIESSELEKEGLSSYLDGHSWGGKAVGEALWELGDRYPRALESLLAGAPNQGRGEEREQVEGTWDNREGCSESH